MKMIRNRLQRIWRRVPGTASKQDESAEEGYQRGQSLREFVYLDEISVVSLLTSIGGGGIPQQMTELEGSEKETSGGVDASATVMGTGKAGLRGDRIKRNNESVETVLSYEDIQSSFTKLYNSPEINRVIEPATSEESDEDYEASRIRTDELNRGDVIELRVQLSAHFLFQLQAAYRHLADTFPDAVAPEDEQQLELIASLFDQQIPVVGTAVNYQVVDGKITLKSDMVSSVGSDEDIQDLKIVGHLDTDLLWQSESQVLFSENEYNIYCRIEDTEIQEEWHPMNITRIFNAISPGIATGFNRFIQTVSNATEEEMSAYSEDNLDYSQLPTENPQLAFFRTYTAFVEEEYRITVSDEDLARLIAEIVVKHDGYEERDVTEIEAQKELLQEYTDLLERDYRIDVNAFHRSEFRDAVIDDPFTDTLEPTNELSQPRTDSCFIEANYISVFW